MKRIGIGIIGCGKIAQTRHAPEYAANENVRIVGFCDFVYERAEDMARKYGGRAFASVEEMLSCQEVDAVSVCSANHTHASVALQALQGGKHVLCEKPMAVTMEECEAMGEQAKRADRFLAIAHNQRLHPVHRRAKELLSQGVIDAFVHALQGEKDCVLAVEGILPSMRAMFAAVKSAQTGERVRLSDLS